MPIVVEAPAQSLPGTGCRSRSRAPARRGRACPHCKAIAVADALADQATVAAPVAAAAVTAEAEPRGSRDRPRSRCRRSPTCALPAQLPVVISRTICTDPACANAEVVAVAPGSRRSGSWPAPAPRVPPAAPTRMPSAARSILVFIRASSCRAHVVRPAISGGGSARIAAACLRDVTHLLRRRARLVQVAAGAESDAPARQYGPRGCRASSRPPRTPACPPAAPRATPEAPRAAATAGNIFEFGARGERRERLGGRGDAGHAQ